MKATTTIALSLLTLTIAPNFSQAAGEAQPATIREYFKVVDVEKTIEAATQSSAESLAEATDMPEKARPKMEKFLRDTVGLKAIEGDLIKVYQKHFSEAEMQELVKIYKNPAAMKLAKLQPTIFKDSSAIGEARMRARQSDLHKLIQEFKKK